MKHISHQVVWSLALSALACVPAYLRAECVVIPMKPAKVSGAFCGRLFSRYGPDPLKEMSLVLMDSNGKAVAEARTDGAGNFRFPALAKGLYRVQSGEPGLVIMPEHGGVEITAPAAGKCTKPLTVYVGPSYPDCSGGWVSPKWSPPPKWLKDGGRLDPPLH